MEESRQSRGIGSFFFAAIPAIIAFALLNVLAFTTGIVEFKHSQDEYTKKQTYEGRRETRVGVNGEMLKPVDLVYSSKGCMKIERAYLDTQTLTLYIHNTCSTERNFVKDSVKEYAPDGTVVQSEGGYIELDSGSSSIGQDEKREITVGVSSDSRVVKIAASISEAGRTPNN